MKTPKAVIFDLDGLLVDSEPVYYGAIADLVRRFGKNISIEEYAHEHLGGTLRENAASYIRKFSLPYTEEELMKTIRARVLEETRKGLPLKCGARELLAFCGEQGIKKVLATSSSRERAGLNLRLNRVEEEFDAFIYGEDVRKGKPDPEIFLSAAEKAGCRPEEGLVLEDSEKGILASFRANIPVICVPDLKPPAPAYASLALCVADSLLDVLEMLS